MSSIQDPTSTSTSTDDDTRGPGSGLVDRRTVLAAAGVAGAVGVLAACGTSDSGTSAGGDASPSADAGGGTAGGTELATTDEVPVNGMKLIEDQKIVVTQPAEGDYKAFDATCPHQGCLVSRQEGEDLLCPCHASKFSAETGDVLRGPAITGLAEVNIEVSDGQIVTA